MPARHAPHGMRSGPRAAGCPAGPCGAPGADARNDSEHWCWLLHMGETQCAAGKYRPGLLCACSKPAPARKVRKAARARSARAPPPPLSEVVLSHFHYTSDIPPPARILGPKRFKSVYQPESPGKPIPASPSGRVKTAPRGILRAYSERDDVVPSRIRPQNPPGRPFQTLAGTPWRSVPGGSLRMACGAWVAKQVGFGSFRGPPKGGGCANFLYCSIHARKACPCPQGML